MQLKVCNSKTSGISLNALNVKLVIITKEKTIQRNQLRDEKFAIHLKEAISTEPDFNIG